LSDTPELVVMSAETVSVGSALETCGWAATTTHQS
jgi:hypothetical protein